MRTGTGDGKKSHLVLSPWRMNSSYSFWLMAVSEVSFDCQIVWDKSYGEKVDIFFSPVVGGLSEFENGQFWPH